MLGSLRLPGLHGVAGAATVPPVLTPSPGVPTSPSRLRVSHGMPSVSRLHEVHHADMVLDVPHAISLGPHPLPAWCPEPKFLSLEVCSESVNRTILLGEVGKGGRGAGLSGRTLPCLFLVSGGLLVILGVLVCNCDTTISACVTSGFPLWLIHNLPMWASPVSVSLCPYEDTPDKNLSVD